LQHISLPEGLTGRNMIPSYALQEFHNLPNGYYSNSFPSGYGNGFNFFMLGEMTRIRQNLADHLSGCTSVLDLGCGDGSSTKALCDQGIQDVWGVDPSPYMLVHAIERCPTAKFVQGVGECSEFRDESFDGIGACWLFHEVPGAIADTILSECRRILRPGGKLVIMEPSKHHLTKAYFQLLKGFGWRGLYFRMLSKFVHEPFLKDWLGKSIKHWLESHGFRLISDSNGIPEEAIVAVRA
jgi:ubiquinone/menaquinone biosynthesis C-methylase UbiE